MVHYKHTRKHGASCFWWFVLISTVYSVYRHASRGGEGSTHQAISVTELEDRTTHILTQAVNGSFDIYKRSMGNSTGPLRVGFKDLFVQTDT